jgi:hypothetical protein
VNQYVNGAVAALADAAGESELALTRSKHLRVTDERAG